MTMDTATTAKTELTTLLDLMEIEGEVQALVNAEEVLLQVSSVDAGRLIGRGARVMDALQYLLNRILHRRDPDVARCIVDVEQYRERKRERLEESASQAADRVETISGAPDETGRKCLMVQLVSNTLA